MSNIFSSDSSCVALWKFEDSPGFTNDSIGNNDVAGLTPLKETSIITEGVQSAHFVPASSHYLQIVDSSLNTSFPLRFADGVNVEKDFSIGVWVRFISFLTDPSFIFDKYKSATSQRCISLHVGTSSNSASFLKGYNNGASFEISTHATSFNLNTWYHVSLGYREYDKLLFISITDTSGNTMGSDIVTSMSQETSVFDIPIRIGRSVAGYGTLDGYIDELVVFNRKKTLGEMKNIANGTYNYKDVSNMSLNINTQLNMLGGG